MHGGGGAKAPPLAVWDGENAVDFADRYRPYILSVTRIAIGLILFCILLAPLLPLWMILAASERGKFKRTEAYLASHGRLPGRH